MPKKNAVADAGVFFMDGCGRCPLGGTAACKVHRWSEELQHLRKLLLESGLEETLKWGVACYTYELHNVAIIGVLKDYCSVGFFKGSLMQDSEGLLDKPGEHSQAARQMRFTRVEDVLERSDALKRYLQEAIEIERLGLKVAFTEKENLVFPEELEQAMEDVPALKAAFGALTPGRQRGYVLYFSAPKQAQTRRARIDKCMERIMQGKGMQDS
jgi:uncharacterized protein YdeI (YjbR/CyaY-like superfamily)